MARHIQKFFESLLNYDVILSDSVDFLVTKTTAVVKRISQRNLCLKKRYFGHLELLKNMFQNENDLINCGKVKLLFHTPIRVAMALRGAWAQHEQKMTIATQIGDTNWYV